ncbi:cobalamin 5'-phosphate synthase [Selenomonas sp. oral taxon 920]|uniref:adenosylcobinamide-GDP ribazoletransferase n=1 Tax=Selenomonas sp. oral taxon 920 TaxID=1884263 RepID=UPI000840DB07|nr:adenosylcobinamide-GDP ribazoletransferase [Selenomonas sp. oral taxon 920]AOH47832.1 cobalamin 5'-phosphate synthase [Selenomonas sp. oral taxon 920]
MNSFLVGLQFLTRIHIARQTVWTADAFGRSTRFFPLVGLVLGICYALAAWLLVYFIGMRTLTAVLLLILPLLLTGGLHADGFMDTADGVFSGRERERKLEIMKDSRVGSFGVVSFVLLMFLQFALLLDMHPFLLVPALFIMPIIGRMAMVLAIACFPYARADGMGKTFADMADRKTIVTASVMTVVFVLPCGLLAFVALMLGILFALLFCRAMTTTLGGVTGDVYGAVTVLTETLVLAIFSLASINSDVWGILWR